MSSQIVNMNIAEIIVTVDPVVICTVLGSCVSVCLYTEDGVAGGMIHYALPILPKNGNDNPLRYGDYAIKELIELMTKVTGKHPRTFLAKIIGGAENIASTNESQKVGTANAKLAKKILSDYQIKIVGEDLGGRFGRKILFHVKTGRLQSAFVGPGFSRPSAQKAISQKNPDANNASGQFGTLAKKARGG